MRVKKLEAINNNSYAKNLLLKYSNEDAANKLITSGTGLCYESAIKNLKRLLLDGKSCDLCLGYITKKTDIDKDPFITHAWVECDGEVYQTKNQISDKLENRLIQKINFTPSDLDNIYEKINKELIVESYDTMIDDKKSLKEESNDKKSFNLDELEKSIYDMKIGDSVTVKNYKNGEIYKFVKLGNSNTISAFKNVFGKNHMSSPQHVFGWAKDSLIYADFKPIFSKEESLKEERKQMINNRTKLLKEGASRLEIMKYNKALYSRLEKALNNLPDSLKKYVIMYYGLPWCKNNNWLGGMSDSASNKAINKILSLGNYTEDEIMDEMDNFISCFTPDKSNKSEDEKLKSYLNESLNESLDEARDIAYSISKYLDSKNFYNYDLVDYETVSDKEYKVSFEVDGDWKHDHWRFKDLIHDWAYENDKMIDEMSSETTRDDGSDDFGAQYNIIIVDGNYYESLNEILDDQGVERYGIDGEWWYFTTHGVQPGSVPKGIEILNVIDTPNGTYFCSDRVLNTSELRYYDIKEKYPAGLLGEDINMNVISNMQLDEATLNKQFRKDIKRKYKDNQFINSVNKEKRNSLMKMMSDEDSPKAKDLANRLFPEKPFKYDFSKYLEKNDFPFYVTYYQEYPIYEPAEGGYYYPGRNAIYSKGFNTKEEAEAHVEELKNEDGEGGWEKYSDGYIREGKYVGDAEEIVIETRKTYLSQEKGWEPYQ